MLKEILSIGIIRQRNFIKDESFVFLLEWGVIWCAYIYVWILENGVGFGTKLFRLLAGDSRQGGLKVCDAWKARVFPSRRVGEDSQGIWLPAGTKGRAQGLSPGGWGGSQREAFCSAKLLIFFAAQPLPAMPCRLSGWKPASQTQARWVSKLCVDVTDCLWLIEWKILCILLENCQGGCPEVSTIFKNPDINISYWTFCCVVSLSIFRSCAVGESKYKQRVNVLSDTTQQNV